MLGLYLHIPFCSSICNYCNFNRGLFDPLLKTRYVDALEQEIVQAFEMHAGLAAEARGADTIYFGGGTPSLLEPSDIGRLIGACRRTFDLAPDSEVTLEANPETVSVARLEAYRAAGINRISFGTQSLRDDELQRLSRRHDAARSRGALGEARQAGFDNVSLDLMMWLPGQTLEHWLESIDGMMALGPDHISLYLLELYPNAPLREDMARAAWVQAPDEVAADMYMEAMVRLEKDGYRQYELSNVARPGRRARHNVKYWTDGSWIGFGCGAHSTVAARRWKNVAATEDYITLVSSDRSPAMDLRERDADECLGDALFTGLRLTEGLDLGRIDRRYGTDVWARYGSKLQPFMEAGLLMHENGRMWLTRRGMLLANEVMAVFV